MKLLLYESYKIKSRFSPDELRHILIENVDRKIIFRNPFKSLLDHEDRFEGSIEGNRFIIERIIGYTNSFIPKIYGNILKDNNGSLIHVRMIMHPISYILMIVWTIGITCLTIISTISNINKGESISLTILIPLMFGIAGYLIALGGFKYESLKGKEFLRKLFEGKNQAIKSSLNKEEIN